MHLPGWPGGDPAGLKVASDAWSDLADVFLDVIHQCNVAVFSLESTWSGEAAAAFNEAWKPFIKNCLHAQGEFNTVSGNLEHISDELSEAHKKYEHAVEVAAASLAVGLGLSFLTGGISDALAAETVATETGIIAEIINGIRTVIATIAEALNVSKAVVSGAIVSGFTTAGLDAGEQAADHLWETGHWDIDWKEVGISGLLAGLGGLAAGKVLGAEPTILSRAGVGAAAGAGENWASQIASSLLNDKGMHVKWLTVIESGLEGGGDGVIEGVHDGHEGADGNGGGDGKGDGDGKGGEPKPTDTQPTDTKPTDTKPADTKPTDPKPADTEPNDPKPADTQPTDVRPAPGPHPSPGSHPAPGAHRAPGARAAV